ncbi:hypothetical protein [Halomarina oriensis]|uniref:Uncharacterized protein n=1 Tax=Halomarina oriensis TaxID=671145 RepID=A0A6B0GMV4_9EURY|nr:hypothetical protein [Halomarina oriensis]MWG36104.1 hypothetical protein [Halomarina oriensis]
MPESETDLIDYYPPGWTEQIHDDYLVEWVYDSDSSIFIRLDGTMGDADYTVMAITGVNSDGEEFVTRPVSGLTREPAFEFAEALVYSLNGAIGRISGEPEFNGGGNR